MYVCMHVCTLQGISRRNQCIEEVNRNWNDWKQADSATHCGVTQPRINDLLRGRVSRFSLDALVNIAAALGQRVHVELKAA